MRYTVACAMIVDIHAFDGMGLIEKKGVGSIRGRRFGILVLGIEMIWYQLDTCMNVTRL